MIIGYEKFDFDSLEPVKAEDFKSNTITLEILAYAIEWAKVLNVIALGAWLCKWWYFGGYHVAIDLFYDYASWLMLLIKHGQL